MAAPPKRPPKQDQTSEKGRAELARARRRTQASDRASGRKPERPGEIDHNQIPASPQDDSVRNKRGRPPSPFGSANK